jgi:hypothetical protein
MQTNPSLNRLSTSIPVFGWDTAVVSVLGLFSKDFWVRVQRTGARCDPSNSIIDSGMEELEVLAFEYFKGLRSFTRWRRECPTRIFSAEAGAEFPEVSLVQCSRLI